jgi:hypothetical protein
MQHYGETRNTRTILNGKFYGKKSLKGSKGRFRVVVKWILQTGHKDVNWFKIWPN